MEKSFQELIDTLVGQTKTLATHFIDRGHQIYLVGGAVREMMLGRLDRGAGDLDLSTSATPTETKALLVNFVEQLWSVGERFGTIGCVFKGRVYEITTFRKETYDPTSRKPTVNFGDDILGDLKRRDFTINAMAISLPDGELLDPHNGRQDLEQKRLATPIDPEVLFNEDPLRMLRAARFEAQLGFSPDEKIVETMATMAHRIEIVSKERRLLELRRLLNLPNPAPGLMRLDEVDLLDLVLPGASVERAAALPDMPVDFDLRLALLYVDLKEHFETELRMLHLPGVDMETIKKLLRLTKKACSVEPEASGARELAVAAGDSFVLDKVLALVSVKEPDKVNKIRQLLEMIAEDHEDIFNPPLPLTSQEIMEVLGIPPGPKISAAQILMRDAYYEKGKLSRRQAEKLIKKHLR